VRASSCLLVAHRCSIVRVLDADRPALAQRPHFMPTRPRVVARLRAPLGRGW
jgi:hypothetical protein